MTKPRHVTTSRAARSQEHGRASPLASDSRDYAWVVNFNNGNVNDQHQNNKAFVRLVRSLRASEYPGAEVTLRELHDACRRARRHKVPSENQLAFETFWIDRLIELQRQLNAGTWSPRPCSCFIARRPKAREIHAPDFADRVVHHWLVPQLEAIYEPTFIHDSYANCVGKGTHTAVARLRDFVHQVHSGQGGGWYLQLDIRNFFNSIHRGRLYAMLQRRLQRAGLPEVVQRATHALLARSALKSGVVHRSSPADRAAVPLHKRLENASPGCGLPIGNLSSQFFANVYLDALDQFVKRELKAARYLRYVDDFILVHRERAQLDAWRDRIVAFLRDRLRLELKADQRLRPLCAGIDFLGYVVYPTHTRVRRRVVRHAFAAMRANVPAEQRRAVLASYLGHFSHADAFRLSHSLFAASAHSAKVYK